MLDLLNEMVINWESWTPIQIYESAEPDRFFQLLGQQIAKDVIRYLSPQLLTDPQGGNYDDNAIYMNIFEPIEKFICNLPKSASSEELRKKIQSLKSSDEPSTLCGRIFKHGDVTYSCQECSFDPTCVVCIDCFQKSVHKDHHYKMSTSSGGGLCDCGDIEAWKQNYACSDHGTSSSQDQLGQLGNSPSKCDTASHAKAIRRLPPGIDIRYLLVCQSALRYAYKMFTWKEYLKLPDLFKPNDDDDTVNRLTNTDHKSNNFFTVLFNDEVHTYDQVISTLETVIKCTKQAASITASTISREGRSIVNMGNYKTCCQIKEEIRKLSEKMANVPQLKVEIIHGSVLAHQAFASKLLLWIKEMSTYCDAFRFITAIALQGPDLDRVLNLTLIEQIMLNNTNFWKMVRVQWNDIIISIMLMDYKSKQIFSTLFTRNYKKLMEEYIVDDHEHAVSVTSMTVQVYTVPSLSYLMMEEENALEILSETFIGQCQTYKRENRLNFERRTSSDILSFRRSMSILSDLEYLLHKKPDKWTEKLRRNFEKGALNFINLLSWMQGMDSVKRQLGQHLEYEPEWESGMALQNRLIPVLGRLIYWATDDEETLDNVLLTALERFLEIYNEDGKLYTFREVWNHNANCVLYDVAFSPVSVHLPLTRFIAGLLLGYMPKFSSMAELTLNSLIDTNIVEMMEPSLRTQVMIAQFRAGMWRRNGYSLMNQIYCYHNTKTRDEMLDRDILMLQLGASMIDPNKFLIHLLNKYNLIAWATDEWSNDKSQRRDDENFAQTISIAEEFLHLLLTLIGERHKVGVGKCTQDDILRNEVIQLLSIEPLSRSDLINLLAPDRNIDLDCIETVADFKRPSPSVSGRYELKEEFYDRFNPYFYHYSRRDQSNAQDAQLKRKKARGERLICCPPPSPIEITKEFEYLLNILKSDLMLEIMKVVIERTLKADTGVTIRFYPTENQLEKVLHLIGLGLYEQERDPTEFNFIEEATKKDIFKLLDKCLKLKQGRDLIVWVIEKFKDVVNKQSKDLDVKTISTFSQIGAELDSSSVDSTNNSQDEKRKNQELATKRKARIMAQMKASQERFLFNCAKQAEREANSEQAKSSSAPRLQTSTSSLPSQTSSTAGSQNLSIDATVSTPRSSHEPQQTSGLPPRYNTRSTSLRKPIINMLANRRAGGVNTSGGSTSAAKITEKLSSVKGSDVKNQLEDDDDDDDDAECNMDSTSIKDEESNQEKISLLCIFCREEQVIGFDQPCMVLSAFVQRSTVLSKNRHRTIPSYTVSSNQPSSSDLDQCNESSDNYDPLFMSSDLYFGPHVSTCGHVMHHSCWQKYFESIERKERSRPTRIGRNNSYEIDRNEVLCPLCECISNSVIPILPKLTRVSSKSRTVFSTSERDFQRTTENLDTCIKALHHAVQCLRTTRHLTKSLTQTTVRPSTTASASITTQNPSDDDRYITRFKPKELNKVLEELPEPMGLSFRQCIEDFRTNRIDANVFPKSMLETMSGLSQRIYMIGLNQQPNQHDDRVPLMTYWSVSYSIQTLERLMRDKNQPIFQADMSSRNLCLLSLIKFSTASVMIHPSDVIQSHLMKILRYLLVNEHHQASPPSCLDIDSFGLLVTLIIGLPKIYSNDDFSSNNRHQQDNQSWMTNAYRHDYFRNILHLMVVFNLMQVIISKHMAFTNASNDHPDSGQYDSEESSNMDMDIDMDSSVNEADKIDNKDTKSLLSFYQKIVLASGHPNRELPEESSLLLDIRERLLPFLRCAALFFHNALEVSEPVEFDGKKSLTKQVEFDSLCNYLKLPNKFSKLLESESVRQLALQWARHPRILQLIKSSNNEQSTKSTESTSTLSTDKTINQDLASTSSRSSFAIGSHFKSKKSVHKTCIDKIISSSDGNNDSHCSSNVFPLKFIEQPHTVNQLIELPNDYSELINKVSSFACPNIENEESRTPTLCLVCGAILCSQSYCCQKDLFALSGNIGSASSSGIQLTHSSSNNRSSTNNQSLVGSCTYHAYECCAGVGIFLRIRDCKILLISGKSKGCYMPAPYVDEYGETDFGLQRGNPLNLSEEEYKRLQLMWLQHSIPEQISRTLEHSSYASSINWHLH